MTYRYRAACRRFWSAEVWVFLGLWSALMFFGRDRLFQDPGTFWHVVVGQRMLDSGELPRTDPFSFTMAGKAWFPQSWLAECGMAALHKAAGFDGILWATATSLAAFYTWLMHRLMQRGLQFILALLVTALVVLGSAYHLHPRPHLVSMMLLAWVFARLCDVEAGRLPVRSLVWFLPMFVVWSNLHGGVVAGWGTLAITAAGWVSAKSLGLPVQHPQDKIPAWFGPYVIACAGAAVINPYGLELPKIWWELASSPVLPRLIQEHAALPDSGAAGLTVVFLALIYLAALLGTFPRRPRVTWLIPVVWFYFAWTRIRHGPLFAVTAGIALAEMFPYVRWVGWLVRHGSQAFQLRQVNPASATCGLDLRPLVVPVLAATLCLGFQVSALPVPVLGRGWVDISRTSYPLDLTPTLHEYARTRPRPARIFNEMIFGGFLIYYVPESKVFIDDRCELYGEQKLEEYRRAALENPGKIDAWAQEYDFELALVVTGSRFDEYLRTGNGWKTLGQTSSATLYQTRISDLPMKSGR